MIDQGELKTAMEYYPEVGVFVWLRPSAYHCEKTHAEAGGPVDCGNGKAYHVITFKGRKFKRSRLAWLYMTGQWPPHQVDHINGNSLDDRWENLRSATATQNAWNHKRRAKRSDLPMGVRELKGRFQARIAVDRKMKHLGCFDTPEQAAAAYLNAREVYYGEFA